MKKRLYISLLLLGISITVLNAEKYIYHLVQKGEAVSSIAHKYKVSTEDIYKLNPGCEKVLWAGATLCIPSSSQTNGLVGITDDTLHIEVKIHEFLENIDKLSASDVNSLQDIEVVKKKLSQLQTRWTTYYQAKQAIIADNDSLLNLVTEYQQKQQGLSDSLNMYKAETEKVVQFNKDVNFIKGKEKEYDIMASTAEKLALVEKSAPLLDKLKNKEQVLMAEIDQRYQAASETAQNNPTLKKSMEELTNVYLEIKSNSEKIQAAEFKPFFERIKDYLLGFAAVAIILMFFNVVQSKIGAVKKLREQQKKMKDLFPQNNDPNTPTI